MTQVDGLTMADPAAVACPFPFYAELQEHSPIYRDPTTGFFEVTRQEDIRRIALDPKTFSNRFNRQSGRPAELQAELQALYEAAGFPPVPTLLNNDPPDQKAIRSLVDKAFLPARINALRPAVLAEVDRLIDGFIDAGSVEFQSAFAIALPVNIIADQLGVARDQRTVIRRGSDALVAVADPLTADDAMLDLTRRIIAMQQLLADRIKHVRGKPDDTILSVVANDPAQRYEVPLLVHLFQSILVAGNETTTNALGNALLLLIDDPALFAALRADADLIRPFVEESLRFNAPFQGFFRIATRDTEMHGTVMPAGSLVMLRWGAAGHDPRVFACPETFRLDRDNLSRHLSFGAGPHFCLGNLLARLELRTSFERLVKRLDRLRLADGPQARVLAPSFFNRGVARIELLFDRAR